MRTPWIYYEQAKYICQYHIHLMGIAKSWKQSDHFTSHLRSDHYLMEVSFYLINFFGGKQNCIHSKIQNSGQPVL